MDETREIDLLELSNYLLKRIYWPLLVAVVFGVVAFLYTKLAITPIYRTATRIYILNQTGNTVSYSDIQSSHQLAADYGILITGKNVTREVIRTLGLNCSDSALASKISVSVVNDTRIIQISASDSDPKTAAAIANCVREVAAKQILEIMGVDAVNLVYEASVPTTPAAPNAKQNTIFAAAIGFLLVIGIFTLIFLMDETIKNEDDVTHYLGLNTIGTIPITDILIEKKHGGKK